MSRSRSIRHPSALAKTRARVRADRALLAEIAARAAATADLDAARYALLDPYFDVLEAEDALRADRAVAERDLARARKERDRSA
jgi:hypothetical protein